MLTLKDVLTNLINPNLDTMSQEQVLSQVISEVVIDSRKATPGSLFVALPGERSNGHNYVAEALQAGAVAAIIERDVGHEVQANCLTVSPGHQSKTWRLPICLKVSNSLIGLQTLAAYWRKQFSPLVIGVTGSVGKTSTKELTYAVLAQRYQTLKSEGSLNNEIGLPLTLLNLTQAHESLVLEMGTYGLGEISALCHLASPQVGLVTNIGPTHLERMGTLDHIRWAKQELVEFLNSKGTAILNADDSLVFAMRDHTDARVFTYGLSEQADLRADNIVSEGLEGVHFVFHYQNEAIPVKIPLLGRHSVYTALGAASVGLTQGLNWHEIMTGLQRKTPPVRLVTVPGPNNSLILDDTYNASPASSLAALNLLAEIKAPRKIAVLGTMAELGPYAEEGHRKVGCRSAAVVDHLVTVGQQAHWIAEEAIACGLKPEETKAMLDSRTLADYLKMTATQGDIILIKGSRALALEKTIADLRINTAAYDSPGIDRSVGIDHSTQEYVL